MTVSHSRPAAFLALLTVLLLACESEPFAAATSGASDPPPRYAVLGSPDMFQGLVDAACCEARLHRRNSTSRSAACSRWSRQCWPRSGCTAS